MQEEMAESIQDLDNGWMWSDCSDHAGLPTMLGQAL